MTSAESRLPYGRIFVTGGNGFVGMHLLPALQGRLSSDARIFVAQHGSAALSIGESVPFDLFDEHSIRDAILGVRPDLVIHLAGEASVVTASEEAARTWTANFCGTLTLASALAACSPGATFLFVSSAEVYGDAFADGTVTEATAPRPSSVYAQSKLASEQMLASVVPAAGTLIVTRPCNHIGPGQSTRFALPSFAEQIAAGEAEGKPVRICVGDLGSLRDFLDVRDVVGAYIRLIESKALRGRQSIVNVSSGTERSVASMLDQLRGLADIPTEVVIDPERLRPPEPYGRRIDASRLRALTGWAPEWPLERTLREILDWRRSGISAPSIQG